MHICTHPRTHTHTHMYVHIHTFPSLKFFCCYHALLQAGNENGQDADLPEHLFAVSVACDQLDQCLQQQNGQLQMSGGGEEADDGGGGEEADDGGGGEEADDGGGGEEADDGGEGRKQMTGGRGGSR